MAKIVQTSAMKACFQMAECSLSYTKIQNLSEISPEIRFTEYDFYDFYTKTFRMTELGRMHSLIPFKQQVVDFGA